MAGGRSRRMGKNKALIEIDGRTIIERAAGVLSPIFDDFFLVANEIDLYEHLDYPIITDLIKGAGSLGGIYTALVHSSYNGCFVAACDMPLIDAASVKAVVEAAEETGTLYDAVVPFIDERLHAMHAVYFKSCIRTIEEMIEGGDLRTTDLFERIRTLRLDLDYFIDRGVEGIRSSVENINTAEDLKRLGIELE